MSKKLFISLAPVLAIAAFAIMPVAAQAVLTEPVYYSGAAGTTLVTATNKTVVSWGTLTLKTIKGGTGEVTCHNAAAGVIKNPNGTASPGEGLTQIFATFDCEKVPCQTVGLPAGFEPSVLGEKLPWAAKQESVGVHESKSLTTGVKVAIGCDTIEKSPTNGGPGPAGADTIEAKPNAPGSGEGLKSNFFALVKDFGSNKPRNTANARSLTLGPPGLTFGPGTGELEQEPAGSGITGQTEGSLKVIGYANQEIITVCDENPATACP